jgi:integrase/recombinase XerD
MVKKLGAIASVDNIRPHRFRHDFGTIITRKGLDSLYGKELMRNRAYLQLFGEDGEED